jgi:predicted nuclease with TOPRIM domain
MTDRSTDYQEMYIDAVKSLILAKEENEKLRELFNEAQRRRDAWKRRFVALEAELKQANQRENRCKVAIHCLGRQCQELLDASTLPETP